MRTERLAVMTADRYQFVGEVFTPETETAKTCVAYFDGASMDMASSVVAWPLAEALTRQGIAFAYATNRGTGVERYSRREVEKPNGMSLSRTITGHASELFSESPLDVSAWAHALRNRGYRVILAGHSLGASKVAFAMAASRMPRIDGVLMLAPIDIVSTYRRSKDPTGELEKTALRLRAAGRGQERLFWGKHEMSAAGLVELQHDHEAGDVFPLRNNNPGTALARIHCPIGIIYGNDDQLVTSSPEDDGKLLIRSVKASSNKKVMIVPGDHVFWDRDEFSLAAAQWTAEVSRETPHREASVPRLGGG